MRRNAQVGNIPAGRFMLDGDGSEKLSANMPARLFRFNVQQKHRSNLSKPRTMKGNHSSLTRLPAGVKLSVSDADLHVHVRRRQTPPSAPAFPKRIYVRVLLDKRDEKRRIYYRCINKRLSKFQRASCFLGCPP